MRRLIFATMLTQLGDLRSWRPRSTWSWSRARWPPASRRQGVYTPRCQSPPADDNLPCYSRSAAGACFAGGSQPEPSRRGPILRAPAGSRRRQAHSRSAGPRRCARPKAARTYHREAGRFASPRPPMNDAAEVSYTEQLIADEAVRPQPLQSRSCLWHRAGNISGLRRGINRRGRASLLLLGRRGRKIR